MPAKLTYLVIHCTATPAGRNVTSADIRKWHTDPVSKGGRGWKQVGYADMIHLDGTIENLVPYNDDDVVDAWEITNGQAGINYNSRHVVYVGGRSKNNLLSEDTRTDAQKTALLNYVKSMVKKYPKILVAGHNQFKIKDCPSFSVPQWALAMGIPSKNIYTKWP